VFAMKQLHLQCFNSQLTMSNSKPDLSYLIEQSVGWEASINTANFNNNASEVRRDLNCLEAHFDRQDLF